MTKGDQTVAQEVVLFDVMDAVVNAMVVSGIEKVYFQCGDSNQLIDVLIEKDQNTEENSEKYPLIVMMLPVPIKRGVGYFGQVTIPRIVFSVLAKNEGTQYVVDRYAESENFKGKLYPMYREFLKRLALSTSIMGQDPEFFPHTWIDYPGSRQVAVGVPDWIDSLEIHNLELTLLQLKTCK